MRYTLHGRNVEEVAGNCIIVVEVMILREVGTLRACLNIIAATWETSIIIIHLPLCKR